jgi:2-keto-4-pentenoate hydratase/2-oxohepta-3-ene-1,7-dioic acid hydratase in catechol pathway
MFRRSKRPVIDPITSTKMTVRHFCRLPSPTDPVHAEWNAGAWQPIGSGTFPSTAGGHATHLTSAPKFPEGAGYLVPVTPSKIIGIGKNYRAHAQEMGGTVPSEPLFFLKAPSSLLGPGQPILLPALSQHVDFEGELAVIIGKTAKHVSALEALNYVFGYTVACDVTARDLQHSDGQWSRAKSFDTFCPLAPVITTGIDCSDLRLTTTVNGSVRQSASTRDMVFDVAQIVSHVSHAMTLLPGDLILTGTPEGVGPLSPGDRVTIEIEGLAPLHVHVLAEPTKDS